jgi:hypothetical protein
VKTTYLVCLLHFVNIFIFIISQREMVEWLANLLRFQEVPGLIPGTKTGYPGFSEVLFSLCKQMMKKYLQRSHDRFFRRYITNEVESHHINREPINERLITVCSKKNVRCALSFKRFEIQTEAKRNSMIRNSSAHDY